MGVGGVGNVLIGKVFVVVSSKQQARKTVPTLPIHWIALKMKTQPWAGIKFTRCPWLPVHQLGFGLQSDSTGEELGGPRPVSV